MYAGTPAGSWLRGGGTDSTASHIFSPAVLAAAGALAVGAGTAPAAVALVAASTSSVSSPSPTSSKRSASPSASPSASSPPSASLPASSSFDLRTFLVFLVGDLAWVRLDVLPLPLDPSLPPVLPARCDDNLPSALR